MKRLLIRGDPGVRVGSTIEHDGTEYECFSVTRNGEWHGPDEVQLWCVIGTPDERELYETQRYIPHFLQTDRTAADGIAVLD